MLFQDEPAMATVTIAPPPEAVAAFGGGGPSCKEDQILGGASRVFARDGYEGASMSRIAAEAGVSKGTLYNYFTSKADLFAAYMNRECTRWIGLVFEDLDEAAAPEHSLLQIGRRMFSMMVSEKALVIYRMVIAEAEKFPELAQAFYATGPARATRHLAEYLRRSTAAAQLRVSDPDFAAEQFFALIQTQLCMKCRLRLIDVPSEAQIDHVVECAVNLFMRAYGM
jgi:AcrR family transcriptional regulator